MQNHYVEAYLANRNYISSTKQVNLLSPSILFWCVMSVSHTDGVTLRVSAQWVHFFLAFSNDNEDETKMRWFELKHTADENMKQKQCWLFKEPHHRQFQGYKLFENVIKFCTFFRLLKSDAIFIQLKLTNI